MRTVPRASQTVGSLFIVGMRPLGHEVPAAGIAEGRSAALASAKKAKAEGKESGEGRVTLEWLREHEGDILRAAGQNPFWQANVTAVEASQRMTLTDVARMLDDLGYERVQTIARPGEYERHGGSVELWPLNRRECYRLDFLGNAVETIERLPYERYRAAERRRLLSRRLDLDLIETLKAGEYVVHVDHGIGVFKEVREAKGADGEMARFVVLEYAKGDRLMVPEDKRDRLSLYVGLRAPEVHRLGSTLWLKTRRTVKASAYLFAKHLIGLYAKREVEKGFAYPKDNGMQRSFEAACPFDETIDQRVATDQIKADLEGEKPMERLLAGDVGFGKTEVAMRAAFKAATAGKQVAVLAPTTVLAYQHFRSFRERMKDFPVHVSLLSRMQLHHEHETQEQVLAGIRSGKVDIVIGTHRLLSKDVTFKDLGLLIVDEEQKFGVKQKEKLKTFKANLDVLLLSATPIPRTLNLALSGLREMSVISTPPPGRMPIQTFVLPDSDAMVKEAIAKEMARDGQVYVLWNRVQTMSLARKKVVELAPKGARIAVAHGKMAEEDIIEVMERFRDRKIDILVATTIIENGLDFDHVNTLVVMNASKLGLAQSYQLRGRIGRGSTKAFSYFFYPGELTEEARMRLEALEQFTELGSGYRVAMRDLEIRGAGNILGKEQSGNVFRVGLNLYLSMLAEAVDDLQTSEKRPVAVPALAAPTPDRAAKVRRRA